MFGNSLKKIRLVCLFFVGIVFVSCNYRKPQMPVNHLPHRGKERKVLFAGKDFQQDKKIILNYIKNNDSLDFISSPNAFWWAYLKKDPKAKKVNADVQINYTYSVYNFNNQPIYSKQDIGTKYAVIGKTKQIRALTAILKTLSEGEKAILLVPSFSAYGFTGDGKKIGPLQPIIIKIEILKLKSLKK